MSLEQLPRDAHTVKPVKVAVRQQPDEMRYFGVGIALVAMICSACMVVLFISTVPRIGVPRNVDSGAVAGKSVASSSSAAAVAADESPYLVIDDLAFLDDRAVVTIRGGNLSVDSADLHVSLLDASGQTLIIQPVSHVCLVMRKNIPVENGMFRAVIDVPFDVSALDAVMSVKAYTTSWHQGLHAVERTDLVNEARVAYTG